MAILNTNINYITWIRSEVVRMTLWERITNRHRLARLLKQQTSFTIYRFAVFRLQQTNISYRFRCRFHFPFVASKRNYSIYILIHIPIHIHTYIYNAVQTENGKQNPRHFSFIRLPFAHRKNLSLSFDLLLTMKQREVIRLQTDSTDLPTYANRYRY